jgi:putative transposase
MLSLLASPLFDSLIAPYSHLLELASPLEEKSCGPASPLERGLEDFMRVTPAGVTNAANLSLFMVKVAYHLRTGGRPHAPDYSVLDLKADCRGYKYVEETIKLLPEKPEPVLLAKMRNQVAGLGCIHAAQPAFSFS